MKSRSKTLTEDVRYGKKVIALEAQALERLVDRVDEGFQRAVDFVLHCKGRVVVTGIGKAGIIGQKISATLASTGTPSYWLHPSEARHGDLGRVVKEDVVLALSNSGETEVAALLPFMKKIGAGVIAITGSSESTLARHSNVVLDIGQIEEPCPLGLAPSASSTAMLALGDALALTVLKRRNFSKEEYAFYHPGGEVGRKLLVVEMVMRSGQANPVVKEGCQVLEALKVMTHTPGRPGAVSVVDGKGRLTGFFTDGDLRRRLGRRQDFLKGAIKEVMTRNPKTIRKDSLAAEAYNILKENKIDQLPVVDKKGIPVGILDVQDLLDVGL
ncbi:MAG TPA: KpsF/GutQ family sugar-phosphate isomerase [Candidatus Brocadiales bacterium]|nr:KpsF/GutQ family sugar-phosphate isomerase [Candidatus Brocadiales bacterium]